MNRVQKPSIVYLCRAGHHRYTFVIKSILSGRQIRDNMEHEWTTDYNLPSFHERYYVTLSPKSCHCQYFS
jgi:hypothetical protein